MDSEKTYGGLTRRQIKALVANGCTASEWGDVKVLQPFDAERVKNVHFTGKVFIGTLGGTISLFGGIERKAGVYNATIHNCTLGDNVYISNVENYIANYDIGDDVVIEHVSLLAVEGR